MSTLFENINADYFELCGLTTFYNNNNLYCTYNLT